MHFIVLLIAICLVFCLFDLLSDRYPAMQKQIYNIAFFTIAILCTARYAYGADSYHYILHYRELTGSYTFNVHNGIAFYEPGFEILCAWCKSLGLTFWGLTAVISVAYWGAIYWLFSYVKSHQTIVLLALVVLDHSLFLEQLRQCLAVALIIYAFCCYHKFEWKIIPIALLIAAASVHKTALPMIGFLILCRLAYGLKTDAKAYIVLGVLLMSCVVIALHPILLKIVPFLPGSLQESASYHLMVGKRVQKIFLLYFLAIMCMGYYTQKKQTTGDAQQDKREQVYHWMIWCCIAVIVVLYQYYQILYRIRSYILPFILAWLANTVEVSDIKDKLPKQVLALVLVLFSISLTIELPRQQEKMVGKKYRTSWVWERLYHSETELQERQMTQAKLYWEYDNKKGLQLGFR